MSNMPSAELLAQLKRHEGFMPRPYLCPAGKTTIGYGCNIEAHPQYLMEWPDVFDLVESGVLRGRPLVRALLERGMEWSEAQAAAALQTQAGKTATELERRCPTFRRLLARGETVRADVLLNMAFNLGTPGLLKFKGTMAAIDGALNGDNTWNSVEIHMRNSDWHKQVGDRAKELERQMVTGRR